MNLLAVDAPLGDDEADRGDRDDQRAHPDQRETGDVAEPLPGGSSVRPTSDGAAISRNSSNFSTMKPNAITAIAVRTRGEEGAFIRGVIAEILDHRLPDRQGN